MIDRDKGATVIQRISKSRKCYRCKKMIKRGDGALRWDYDKKIYAHLRCPTT